VKSFGNLRTVLGAGRFAGLWDVNIPTENAAHWLSLGANEIHVHLLSRDETEARVIADDLKAALKVGVTVSAEEPKQNKGHRTEKLVAGLNPAIPVFGQSDAQNKVPERRPHSTSSRTPGALAA
jgi:hypothetical protein